MTEKIQKTREEIYSESTFEWVKTERAGDISRFLQFEIEGGIEYVKFLDSTRIKSELIGDVVLLHAPGSGSEILGAELFTSYEELPGPIPEITHNVHHAVQSRVPEKAAETDPVYSILEKSKKRTEKISLTLVVRIPSQELYNVMKSNFDNVEEILLSNVMEQIHTGTIRDSVRRELQNIYSKKKKN